MSQRISYLEQERTKYVYQDRHNNNCPLSSRLPQVGVASNTQMSGGAEVDVGDDASVVRRRGRAMGPGAFLRQLASDIPQYWGPP
jgi:hypothetical protein